jgi:O-antigen ligase
MGIRSISVNKLIYSLLAFLAFWYFYFASTYSLRPVPQLFWVLLAAISICLGCIHRYKITKMDQIFFGVMFALLLFSLFSVNSYESAMEVGYFIIYYIVAKMIITNCEGETIHNIILFFSIVHLICMLIQVFLPSTYTAVLLPLLPGSSRTMITEQMNWNAAYYGFTIQSSMSAMYLSIGAILSAIKLKKADKKIFKVAYLVLIALFLVATFYTQRRGSSAAVLVVLALIYMRTKGNRGSKILLAVSVIALVAIVGIQNIPGLSGIMNKMTTFIATGSFMNGRDTNFSNAISAFLQRPIFGYGGGQIEAAMGYAWLENSFLAVLLQWGFIGFFLFFWPFVKMFKGTIYALKWENSYNPYLEFSLYIQILFFIMSFVENYYGAALNCFLLFTVVGAGNMYNWKKQSFNDTEIEER